MKRCLAVLVAFMASFGVACDDDDESTAIAPTATAAAFETPVSPPVAPTPTIPRFPTVLPPMNTAGWIVYHRGADLWVGKLDGSSASPLVEGALGSQYAGLATAADGTRTLYFTALVERLGEEPNIEGGTVEVRRLSFEEPDAIETVTSFRVSQKQADEFGFSLWPSDVSVAPDERHLAYTDETGLWLWELASGSARRLLTNGTCNNRSTGSCYAFRSPSWSPAGEWLALTRVLYEGAVADFIRPLEPVTEYTSDVGAIWRGWSADGTQVCGPDGRLQPLGWGVVKPGEPIVREDGATTLADKYRDIDEELQRVGVEIGGWITDCAWNDRGEIALLYAHDDLGYDQRIAVLAADGTFVSAIDSQLNQSGLAGWLPDGSGFIAVYGDGEGPPMSFIVALDGSVHRLALEADDVIAVIPE